MRVKLQSPIKVTKGTTGIWGNKELPPDWITLGVLDDLFGGQGQYLKDFLEVPELNAIINIRARAMASGKTDAISKVTGTSQAANQSLVRTLRRPNWFQGEKEFWRQSSLWRDIFGNEYIYFLTPVGMPNSFKGMFTLDPSLVKITYKPKDLYFLNATDEGVAYSYVWQGREIPLDKENLIHLNDNRVQTSNILKGTSKIDSLKASIKNIRAAYEKRNVVLTMPPGILSNNAQSDAIGTTLPMQEEEKTALQAKLKTRKAQSILTSLSLKWDNMEISSQKLGLFEEVREDTMRLCDAYGVKYDLLSGQKGSALSDGGRAIKESRKQMYEDTIIPDVQEKDSAINNHIGAEMLSWEIKTDFSHLPVFAEDQKQRAISIKQLVEALSKALADNAITVEQYQSELKKYGIL